MSAIVAIILFVIGNINKSPIKYDKTVTETDIINICVKLSSVLSDNIISKTIAISKNFIIIADKCFIIISPFFMNFDFI